MRLLLDTHVVLWMLSDSPRLTQRDRAVLGADDAECYVSVASWWELAIKESRGVHALSLRAADIRAAALDAGLRELSVAAAPALRVADFPLLHRDPFDRMLIAQALCEPMRLVTADAMVATYAPVCGVLIERVGGA